MKRLIHREELVDQGLFHAFAKLMFETGCAQHSPELRAIRLWRSRKGYRKACRMLRRAGCAIDLRQVSARGWRRINEKLATHHAPKLAEAICRPNPLLEPKP